MLQLEGGLEAGCGGPKDAKKVEGAAPSQRRCRKGPTPPNSAHLPVAQRRPFQGLPAWGVNKERGGKILSPEKSVV